MGNILYNTGSNDLSGDSDGSLYIFEAEESNISVNSLAANIVRLCSDSGSNSGSDSGSNSGSDSGSNSGPSVTPVPISYNIPQMYVDGMQDLLRESLANHGKNLRSDVLTLEFTIECLNKVLDELKVHSEGSCEDLELYFEEARKIIDAAESALLNSKFALGVSIKASLELPEIASIKQVINKLLVKNKKCFSKIVRAFEEANKFEEHRDEILGAIYAAINNNQGIAMEDKTLQDIAWKINGASSIFPKILETAKESQEKFAEFKIVNEELESRISLAFENVKRAESLIESWK